ncbi:hypothetical protein [Horticoccus sp. 23ND18S-11]|uniref:hypothetical protein n=1 Tax=Horticoccus sp. 23ND18S-11 TaxID=3391832 RepID=UPI0039C97A8A
MLTSRRDYILRIIDEVGRLLARVVFKRRNGEPDQALQAVVQACERLFSLEADKLFQFTPEQHFVMLTDGETPEIARDKVLLYAALNAEAAHAYTALGNAAMARATALNALRFSLRARVEFPANNLPAFAPNPALLREQLGATPLDEGTLELLKRAGLS